MAVALDGSGFFNLQIVASGSFGLTTTNQPGLIVVAVQSDDALGPATPTASGGSLTFSQRGSDFINGGQTTRIYTAPYTSNTAFTINIATFSGAVHTLEGTGFGVSGTNGVFDAAGPVIGTSGSISITTTSTTDFVWCTCYTTGGGGSGTLNGWTSINSGYTTILTMYQIGAPGTYNSGLNPGQNNTPGSWVDAITPGVASVVTLMGSICM